MPTRRLTFKRKKFCEAYLANNGNGAAAARAVGYSKNCAKETASDILTCPNIKEYLEKRMCERLEKIGITFETNALVLKELYERCLKGEATREGIIHPSGILGAIDLLNKMGGHYKETGEEDTSLHKVFELDKKYEREN